MKFKELWHPQLNEEDAPRAREYVNFKFTNDKNLPPRTPYP